MSDRFMPGVAERLGWYVYLLIDPRQNDEVFYIGKGRGNRCFAHVAEARSTGVDVAQGYEKLDRIRDIERSGDAVEIDILCHELTEEDAFRVEAAVINLLGLEQLANQTAGQGCRRLSVAAINSRYARPVVVAPEHSVVLVNVRRSYRPGMSDAELYERTRKWWPIVEWRRRVGAPGAPLWAFSVAGGVVRAVYRIESWEQPSPDVIAEDPKRVRRWAFVGARDYGMEERYLYGDVSRYITSQWPLRFITDSSEHVPEPASIVSSAIQAGHREQRHEQVAGGKS